MQANNGNKSTTLTVTNQEPMAKEELNFDLVRKYIAPTASDGEIYAFLQLCRHQGYNPFLREIYLIKWDPKSPASYVVSKDSYFKRADSLAEFDGLDAGIIVRDKEQQLVYRQGSFIEQDETLLGGWAVCYRKDRSHPIRSEVSLDEYRRNTKPWREMACTMIRKIACVQSLRESFPSAFGGTYDAAELPIEPSSIPEYRMTDPTEPQDVIEVETEPEAIPSLADTPEHAEEPNHVLDKVSQVDNVTVKQIGLVNRLLSQKFGLKDKQARREYLEREFNYDGRNMSKTEASLVIKQLLSLPDQGGRNDD